MAAEQLEVIPETRRDEGSWKTVRPQPRFHTPPGSLQLMASPAAPAGTTTAAAELKMYDCGGYLGYRMRGVSRVPKGRLLAVCDPKYV